MEHRCYWDRDSNSPDPPSSDIDVGEDSVNSSVDMFSRKSLC